MYKLWVIGIGPGHEDYILPIAKSKVKAADIVLGGQRHLDAFNTTAVKQKFIVPLEDNLILMRELLQTKQVAVLLSGDTGFYSMLKMIKKEFDISEIVTFPGISSLSYMFSKLNLSYEQALLTSGHGRNLDISSFDGYEIIGFLTDKVHGPKWLQNIFKYKKGKIHIGIDLSYVTEKIVTYNIQDDIPEMDYKLCVVVIEIE